MNVLKTNYRHREELIRENIEQGPGAIRSDLMGTRNACTLPKLTNLTREETIGQYHVLMKQLAAVDRDVAFPTPASKNARKAILRSQLKMIGVDRYQQASRAGEYAHGGFDSSKWVLNVFKSRDDVATLANKLGTNYTSIPNSFPPTATSTTSECLKHESSLLLRVLDVGAIVHRFPPSVHLNNGEGATLDVVSIDLDPVKESDRSRDGSLKQLATAKPRVLKADIIQFSREHLQERSKAPFDAVILSLCVNFEGCPWRRGEMLYYASRILRKGGLLFFVLPLQCIQNSRYCDEETLQCLLLALGLNVVSKETTAALLLWTAARCEDDEGNNFLANCGERSYKNLGKKRVVRSGTSRNNFCICLGANFLHKRGSVPDMESSTGNPDKARRGKRKALKQRALPAKVQSGVDKPKKLTSNQRKRARRRAKFSKPHEHQRGKAA